MEKERKKHNHQHANCHQKHCHEASSCGHHHDSKLNLILFLVGVVLFLIGMFIEHKVVQSSIYIIATLLAGYHVISEGFIDTIKQTIQKKKFSPNIHILMTLAAIGAIIIGDYHEAALLILIFAGAHFLEDYAEGRSKKEITNLLKLNPKQARRINENGDIEIVFTEDLKIGDQLQVLIGDQIPTDGVIINGEATINESSITGESIPVDKIKGDIVFGSTVNEMGTFMMEVTKDNKDTVLAKIIEMVSQTQNNISKTAVLIKRIEPIYVTIIILFAPLFYLLGLYVFNWGGDLSFYRTMVFLIVASPCALAATDIPATLSAISNLAKKGLLFKGGSYLSNLSDAKVVAFDKTGTLTEGKPKVTDVFIMPEYQEKITMYENIIVSMESKSNHPLANAIIEHYNHIKIMDLDVKNILGVGLIYQHDNDMYCIGKPSTFNTISKQIVEQTAQFESDGKTVIYFGKNDQVIAVIALLDVAKNETKQVIDYLVKNDIKPVMITGDAIKTGQAIGKNLGIQEVMGNVLPENKASIIKALKSRYGVTVMLGDGVNDAPALVEAHVGIAMGNGTDIAIDVADGVLMKNDLTKFVYAHKVSKKLRRIVWQNIIFSMLVVIFLVIMNIIGLMNMPYAVLIHEGSTVVVILNGLRLLKTIK